MNRTDVSASAGCSARLAIGPRLGGALMDEQSRSLLEVAGSVLGELDLEVVVDRVLESARELTGAQYAALGVLDALEDGA